MNKEMNPELKKAFRATIERWEKIVDDVDYYYDSRCPLCVLYYMHDCEGCPINEKAKGDKCYGTPWNDFKNQEGNTKENALRELVFLKNLYIELIDCPKLEDEEICKECLRVGWEKRAKPKEEWVDITDEIEIKVSSVGSMGKFRYLRFMYKGDNINYTITKTTNPKCLEFNQSRTGFKVEWQDGDFRVLKKETTWK